MRSEIETILGNKGLEFFDLDFCARLLLVTDGTVTELLEALVGEPIKLGYKHQSLIENPDSQLKRCLDRQITLQGEVSRTHWIYAESRVFLDTISAKAQSMLINESTPIGAVLNQESSDNHRKIIDCGFHHNLEASKKLGLPSDFLFLFREYYVVANLETLMIIKEWFATDRITHGSR